ncbi:pseudouridine synthase [Pseudomonadales bacterium]|nr:pseudouridine synthase [Pseudomonadales bacterium]
MEFLLFNKPYQVLCQFTDNKNNTGDASEENSTPTKRDTLSQFIDRPNFYPAGRLDYLSEGLLILTDNGALQARITEPANKMEKSYWVQVEGAPSENALEQLRKGVILKDGKTLPARIERLSETPPVWVREPPVVNHREQNSQWINISIRQGKNRQVRRMMASVGHPVLRLIRHQIGPWKLEALAPGESKMVTVNLPNSSKKPLATNKRTQAKSKKNAKLKR